MYTGAPSLKRGSNSLYRAYSLHRRMQPFQYGATSSAGVGIDNGKAGDRSIQRMRQQLTRQVVRISNIGL